LVADSSAYTDMNPPRLLAAADADISQFRISASLDGFD
jgi:hypothetical protein